MCLRFRILAAPPEMRARWIAGGLSALAGGPSEERTFEIATELDEVRIGRQPGIEIELPFPGVSSVHARVYRGGELPGDWWVEDFGSTNGSWVDGQRLSPRRPARLRAGQRLRIATVDIVFEGWSAAPRGAESTATIARRLISDLFGVVGGDVPALVTESGPTRQSSVRLADRDRKYFAGRADGCDLVLQSEHVSREHAAFIRRWDGVTVHDLGSKNGVLVNGSRISGEQRLADGDRIEIGPIMIRLTDPEDRYLQHLHSLTGDAVEMMAAAATSGDGANAAPPTGARRTPAVPASPSPASTPTPAAPIAPPASSPDPAPPARASPRRLITALVGAVVVIAFASLVALLLATR
jgi:pSer/pThr/pTyr-binding forkhead associated (FHA) protein